MPVHTHTNTTYTHTHTNTPLDVKHASCIYVTYSLVTLLFIRVIIKVQKGNIFGFEENPNYLKLFMVSRAHATDC